MSPFLPSGAFQKAVALIVVTGMVLSSTFLGGRSACPLHRTSIEAMKHNRANAAISLPLQALKEGGAQCSHHGGLVPAHAVGQQPPGSATGSVPRTCQCLKGYTGDSCQARANTTSDKWQIHAENAHKFDGYAKTVCPNKLSTSGRIPGMTPRRSWCTR